MAPRVLEEYRLGCPLGIRELQGGFRSRVWKVTMACGEFVLRESNSEFSRERVATSAECQQSLFQFHLAPELIETASGKSYATWQGRFYSLSRFVDATELSSGQLLPEQWERFGSFLGRVHNALTCFEPNPAASRTFQRFVERPESRLVELARDCCSMPSSASTSLILAHVSQRIAWLRALSANVQVSVHEVPTQWIHGDFWVSNVLFSRRTRDPMVAIDFDQACLFFPQYEVVRAYASSLSSAGEADEKALEDFVAGYAAARGSATPILKGALGLYLWCSLSDTRPYRRMLEGDDAQLAFVEHRMGIIEQFMRRRAGLQSAVDRGACLQRGALAR